MLRKVKSNILGEIESHRVVYIFLAIILLLAFFVRVYRTEALLGFYYDQGRDALVIWKLWHEGKLFLIGPVTGLSGIFLGPFYYYLIAPFYLIGGGNPVYPAVFLAFLSTLAILILYILGRSMHSRTAGIVATIIGAFSYNIMTFGRWLSNPNPIFLISLLLLYSMWMVIRGAGKKWWIAIFFLAGLSLHFEAASAVFYIPMILVFMLFNRKSLPNIKVWLISIGFFAVTLLPQVLFNFRHDNILIDNFFKLFIKEKAFRGITQYFFENRMAYFWEAFSNKLYAGGSKYAYIFLTISFSAIAVGRKVFESGLLKLFLIFIITPLFFYTFYQGNYGNLYDYYLSGYYMPFLLLFSIGLAELAKTKLGKIVVLIFFVTFFRQNGMLTKNLLTATYKTRPLSLEDELQAVNWVFEDAKGRSRYNVDVYVPPVIPHSYDYLFLWKGTSLCGDDLCGQADEHSKLLYILYEADPPHPERLEAWLNKYENTTVIESEEKYGHITVQRRERL